MRRTVEDAELSPRQYLRKRPKPTPEEEAEAVLETKVFKDMLKDYSSILANLQDYLCELHYGDVAEQDPRRLMRLLLEEGFLLYFFICKFHNKYTVGFSAWPSTFKLSKE